MSQPLPSQIVLASLVINTNYLQEGDGARQQNIYATPLKNNTSTLTRNKQNMYSNSTSTKQTENTTLRRNQSTRDQYSKERVIPIRREESLEKVSTLIVFKDSLFV